MHPETAQQWSGRARGTIVAGGAVALIAAFLGWQVVGGDGTSQPEPPTQIETIDTEVAEPNGFEWIVAEPPTDIAYLADVHATSRLQYDECQQGYADVASEPSSGTHPLYFC